MTFLLLALAAYLGYRVGIRRRLGWEEKAADEREEIAYQRSLRPGRITLSTMQIRR